MDDPLVVDLGGSGFALTSLADGVYFDFFNTGTPTKISWTQANSQTGWLAYYWNNDTTIKSGFDLFSNATPQPRSGARIGFTALARFDQRQFGGNANGWIDSGDQMYSKLFVWVDRNHDGIAQPDELATLQQAGIQAISLDYADGHFADINGNRFRYRSQLVSARGSRTTPWVYDVVLLSAGH